ncbi:DUF3857 domain-containing protein [Carboxylicivirga taeanensis]|uniref:DUF3857 domain-containing protein n=1 Tax=Carboxylicivirga taeanensis TaxID=1416875 RepID=UPI003F6E3F26
MSLRTNLLLFYLLFCCTVADSFSNTPNWINPVAFSSTHSIRDNEIPNGYLYLLYDNQVNIDQEEDFFHYAIKIINSNGLSEASTININYDQNYQNLDYHYVKIIRKNETIDVLSKQQPEILRRETRLESGIIDGRLTSFLEIQDLRVGDVIEYAYSITGFNPIKEGLFYNTCNLNYSIPIGETYLMFQTNNQSQYQYKLINNASQPSIKTKGETTQFVWHIQNPEVIDYEDDIPGWFTPYKQVIFSSKISWHKLAQYISELYKTDAPLSKELSTFIAEQKQNYQSKEAIARSIVRYIQNDIRYLGNEDGIYSFKPRNPNEIFKRKSGDCKEKSWLLTTLLNKIGIEAYPALVNTYLSDKISDQPPGFEAFDHCIACVILNNDTLFIDPTITGQVGQLATNIIPDYGFALLINDNTTDLTRVNSNLFYETKITEEYSIKDYSGNARLHVTTRYKGYDAEINRQHFKNSTTNDIQEQYLQFYASTYPQIDTLKLLTFKDDSINNSFEVKESYLIKNIWSREDSTTSKITAFFSAKALNYEISRTVYPERKSPMWQKFPLRYRQELILNLPEEWTISDSRSSIHGPGFNFYNTIIKNGKSIFLSYDYQTTTKSVNKEDYQEFIVKNENVGDELSYELYNYGGLTDNTTSGSLNIQMIIIAIFTCIFGIYLASKLYNYDLPSPLSNNESRPIGGWIVLIAFGVTLTPFILSYSIYSIGYFHLNNWEHIFNASSDEYSLELGTFIIIEMVFNILFLIFSCLNVILFYQRRSIFPRVFIAYITLNFIFIVIDNIIATSFDIASFDNETNLDLVRRVIYMCIWIPYLLISERSKDTFVRILRTNRINT